ncbi:ROK-family transcriptional regulator [Streptomyces sp. KY70]|nr:ROK-family transcriptional regulator [Streptomyces sp. KY70]
MGARGLRRDRQRGAGRRGRGHGQPGQRPRLARLPAGGAGAEDDRRAAGRAGRRRGRDDGGRALAGGGARLRQRALPRRVDGRRRWPGPRRHAAPGPLRQRGPYRPHQRRPGRRPVPLRCARLRRAHRQRPEHRPPRPGRRLAPRPGRRHHGRRGGRRRARAGDPVALASYERAAQALAAGIAATATLVEIDIAVIGGEWRAPARCSSRRCAAACATTPRSRSSAGSPSRPP